MSKKNIELELRAEVDKKQYTKLLTKLKKKTKSISHTRRLSVMYFGKINKTSFDIRVRITNGESEIAIKKGALHTHDRIEVTQPIKKSQFIGISKICNLFDFKSEVAERETYNFDLEDKVIFSLVNAGEITYVEVEKMSSPQDIDKNKKKILKILNYYKLKPITQENNFNKLCNRLSKYSDWEFTGSNRDIDKLKKLLIKY